MKKCKGGFLPLVIKSLNSRRLDLVSNHEIFLQNFSFSSRNWRKYLWISLLISKLEKMVKISPFWLQKFSFSSRTRKQISKFLFLFSKLEKIADFSIFWAKVLFSLLEPDLKISLFFSRNSRYGFHISLSLLDFTFWHLVNACISLFLLIIWHFGLYISFENLESVLL